MDLHAKTLQFLTEGPRDEETAGRGREGERAGDRQDIPTKPGSAQLSLGNSED